MLGLSRVVAERCSLWGYPSDRGAGSDGLSGSRRKWYSCLPHVQGKTSARRILKLKKSISTVQNERFPETVPASCQDYVRDRKERLLAHQAKVKELLDLVSKKSASVEESKNKNKSKNLFSRFFRRSSDSQRTCSRRQPTQRENRLKNKKNELEKLSRSLKAEQRALDEVSHSISEKLKIVTGVQADVMASWPSLAMAASDSTCSEDMQRRKAFEQLTREDIAQAEVMKNMLARSRMADGALDCLEKRARDDSRLYDIAKSLAVVTGCVEDTSGAPGTIDLKPIVQRLFDFDGVAFEERAVYRDYFSTTQKIGNALSGDLPSVARKLQEEAEDSQFFDSLLAPILETGPEKRDSAASGHFFS